MAVVAGWQGRFFEDFVVGDVYQHPLGRTITETDNTWFTLLTMNTNQAHFNAQVGAESEFGRMLVASPLTISIVMGQSVSDTSQNAFANLGIDELRLTAPVFAGDTLYAESLVLSARGSGSRPDAGIVGVRTRGLNQDGVEVLTFKRAFYVHRRDAPRAAAPFPQAADAAVAGERGAPVKPLEDIRIVSLEQYGAGPFGSMHLAELGAEVIKIEDPSSGGDVGRYVPPYAQDGDSLFFESFNKNKSSVMLDIRSDAGREVFHDLVRSADAVYSNLRGDVPAKLGIRYADLADVNPRIVCCSLTGFGMTGPRSGEPGYDYVLQALGGWMSLTGEPGGAPQKAGLSLVDYSGGFVAAIALLAGIHAARRDGVGTDCDLSLYDTAVSLLTYPATWHLTEGYTPARTHHSAHPSLVPFQAFEAADGWLVVGCAKEKFWQRLTVVLERPDLAEDPRFATFRDRDVHRDVLVPLLEELFAARAVDVWIAAMRRGGHPVRTDPRGRRGPRRPPHRRARARGRDRAHPLGHRAVAALAGACRPARGRHARGPRRARDGRAHRLGAARDRLRRRAPGRAAGGGRVR